MKKISTREAFLLIMLVVFILGIAITWFIRNRKKIHAQWLEMQKEIKQLRFKLQNISLREARQRKNAIITLMLLKLLSLIPYYYFASWVHYQFGLNPLSAFLGAYSATIAIYYICMYLFSKKIYGLTEFLEIIQTALTKLLLKLNKITPEELKLIEVQIETKQQLALQLKAQLRPNK